MTTEYVPVESYPTAHIGGLITMNGKLYRIAGYVAVANVWGVQPV